MDDWIVDKEALLKMMLMRRVMSASSRVSGALASQHRRQQLVQPAGMLRLAAMSRSLAAIAWGLRTGASTNQYRMRYRPSQQRTYTPGPPRNMNSTRPQSESSRLRSSLAPALVVATTFSKRSAEGLRLGLAHLKEVPHVARTDRIALRQIPR
jgi:hypothetical protein